MKVLIIYVGFIVAANAYSIGEHVKRCPNAGQEAKDCYLEAINNYIPILRKGVPSLGLKSLDPLKAKDLSFVVDVGQNHYVLTLPQPEIRGLSKARATDMRFENGLGVTITIPELKIDTDFLSDYIIFGLNGSDSGYLMASLANVTLMNDITHHLEFNDGVLYTKIDNVETDMRTQGVRMRTQNVEGTIPDVSDESYNAFLENNATNVVELLSPQIQVYFEKMLKQILGALLHDHPLHTYLDDV